ncbi:MAG: histone deacetylase [Desulfobacterales bacterium]|jgi:acetoin utilization deacetylase AcuC-like enzyme
MILYDDSRKEGLVAFGIEIPVLLSRVLNTFEFLKSHPVLGPEIDRWHIRQIAETISRDDLLRVHSGEYIEKLFSAGLEHEIINTFELIDEAGNYFRYNPDGATEPLTQLFDRILDIVASTVECCRVALTKGFCFAFTGGMHHAQREYGAGFCMLNDIVIAIRKLQAEGLIRTAWVIDIDAHKGDGTAALTRGDDTITTLSIHMGNGWPLDGDETDPRGNFNPSFTPSDIDIPMAKGEDHLYIPRLQEGLNRLSGWTRPDLAVVVSGADPYSKDELPSTSDLKLTLAQLKERDLLTYNFLKERDIPRAYLMAGGYGESCWEVYAQFLEWALIDNLGLRNS